MFKKIGQMLKAYKLWGQASKLITEWRRNVQETETVAAGVKSSWASKVNWNSAITLLIAVAALFGYKISETDQATVMAAIMAVGSVVTIIIRTFFTTSLTKSSAAKKNGGTP
jgi:hypothetical protein